MDVTGGEAGAGVGVTDGTRGAGAGGNEGGHCCNYCRYCQENENYLEKHVFILQKAAVLSFFYQFVADSFVLFSLTQSHSVTICVPIAHPYSGEDRVLALEM